MNVEISIGEFVDKISILKIKKERITDQGKLNNVLKEYEYLIQLADDNKLDILDSPFFLELTEANLIIWDGEELLREKQRSEQYDSDFIDIANRIHSTNDIRAQIKKEINLKFNSNFVEEKSHQK
jgi:hypothetical protein